MEMLYRVVYLTSSDWDLPHTNLVVTVSSEQSLPISWPSERQALWRIGLGWISAWDTWTQFLNHLLACQIPDLDGWSVGDAQPVAVWREAQGIDDVVVVQGVQVLAIIQIPQQGFAVLATRCAQRSIGRDSDGVQVSIVPVVVQLQFAVCQIPDFHGTIPSAADNDWVYLIGAESNAWHPIGVSIFLNGVLALGQSVPQLDGLVARSRDDLTVVSGESNWENIL